MSGAELSDKFLEKITRLGRSAGLMASLYLSGCSWIVTETVTPPQRDSGPEQPVSVGHIPDANPRFEVRTIAGNKSPYRVLGKTYYVMEKPEGYREQGVASWYGRKFHGRKTSNGELYDMYGMTAAHKTLPIPSYVKVTNTANQRSVIVRVNDRGPFHGGRIIDLTYTAAKKLGFENHGTAPVVVEYIDPHTYTPPASSRPSVAQPSNTAEPPAPTPTNSAGGQLPANTYLQVGAFSSLASAQTLQRQLRAVTGVQIWVVEPDVQKSSLYRVQVGPFSDNFQLMNVRQSIIDANFNAPHVVYR